MDAKVHEAIAAYDAAHPHWQQEKREREIREAKEAEGRAERAREARRQAEQQHQAANNSKAWCDWVDQRIVEHFEAYREPLSDAIGEALAIMRADDRKEVTRAIEEERRSFDAKLAALEQRIKSTPGKLPVAKIWYPESVTYQAEIVGYDGALYQARKDTAQAPDGADWVCIARAGRDGLTPNICGTYDVYKKYERLDIVLCDGAASSRGTIIQAYVQVRAGNC